MRNIYFLYVGPVAKSRIIRRGVLVHTPQHNVTHDLDELAFDIHPRSINQPNFPRYICHIDPVDTNAEGSSTINETPVTRYPPPSSRGRMLLDEWSTLRRRIDDDLPLYCSDLENYKKDTLIIATKYVEDRSDLIRAQEDDSYAANGREICVTAAWEKWELQLDSLISTGPLRRWRKLQLLQAKSKMELILTLERLVRAIKPSVVH